MKKVILINITILIFLLCVVELIFSTKARDTVDQKIKEEFSQNYITHDALYGHRATPNVQIRHKKYKGNQKIIDVTYDLGEGGFRKDLVKSMNIKKHFALFFGGSNMFGVGLNLEQTLPHYFSQRASDYKVYNYGVPGHGPQHMYLILKNENIKMKVEQKSGIGIYRYYTFHRRRLMGTMDWLRWSEGNFPYFYIEDNKLKQDRDFVAGRPVMTTFLKWLGKVSFIKATNWDYPRYFSSDTNKLLCEVIIQSKDRFLELFPKSNFIVEIGIDTYLEDPIINNCLIKNNINFLDMRQFWNEKTMGDHRIQPPYENHQGERANQLAAKKLVEKYVNKIN